MYKIKFFQKTWKKIIGFTSKFSYGLVTLNTGFFLFGLTNKDNKHIDRTR